MAGLDLGAKSTHFEICQNRRVVFFKRKRGLEGHAVKETPSNKDFNQFAIPITPQQLTQSVVTEPTVVQQWTDENGNTWRSMDNGITLWWNGTDWQQT